MKEILRQWRIFLNENASYFGDKFVEYKTLVEKGGDPLETAYDIGLNEIGRGSSRIVFELQDNNDFVLKVINKRELPLHQGTDPNKENVPDRHGFTIQKKRNANMYEADIQIQIENPGLFPKSTEYADDYSWILVEKVEPLSQEEFREQLNLPKDINFMAIQGLIQMIIEAKQNINDKKHYSHEFVAEADSAMAFHDLPTEIDTDIEAEINSGETADDDQTSADAALQSRKPTRKDGIRENIKGILRNTQAVRILMLMAKYDIKSTEFKAANLGISKLNGGKIVLLDTSMWDDKE